jgi:tape measure domain-containing protein
MTQSAGIQLQVGLDLAFFRRQLTTLGATAAGYKLPINIKFDRLSVQNELNALEANIKKRTYRLEVATNLSQEIKNAGTLAKALRGLDNAVQKNKGIANRAAGSTTAGATVDAAKIQTLVNKATKPALQALYIEMSKAKIPMTDVGEGAVKDLRKAIVSGVPGITQDLARGLANGLNPELKENGTKGAKTFIDAFKTAAGIASPSKVFKALGKFSADGLEIGFLNGLKDFKTKAIGEIKQIVALMKLELASVGNVRIGPGTGAARAGARGGRQYMNPIGPLPEGSREPWAFSQYRYQPFMAQPGQARGANVPPMRTRQPFLPAPPIMGTTSSPGMLGQARLALPAAGETSARAMREAALALREFTARQRSEARSASVMGENRMWSRVAGQVPVGTGGPFLPPGAGGGVPPRPPSGGGGGMGGMSNFGSALGSVNLPGAGVVREIGSEFAMAAKQVLLFGTAYKALAFATSFPAQVGQAVGALQSFRNTLKTISPTAEEVRASNEFILDTVDRYNVPLESARTGFTRLYASMAPAGFKGDEIRELFLGISKTSATLGLSADQVDRVTYAFSQMASKGQFMAEEVTGQLGDVIPGALSIMAEAAGMGIKEFKKAMEDGEFVGKAFTQVMSNVPKVLEKEFGKGAEGAAKTFQGLINRMQNSTRLLSEAFEPVAVGFLNSVVVPLTSGIKTITDGFNTFFTGTKAKTAGGMAFAQELERLKPAFEGIRTNVAALMPVLQSFGTTLLEIGKIALQIAGNPLIGYLGRLYLIVLPINMALGILRGLWASNALQLVIFNARVAAGTSTLTAFRGMMAATGATATITAGRIRAFSIALQAAFSATAVGLAVVGLGMIAEAFMTAGARADAAKQKMLQFADSVKQLGAIGDVAGATAEKVGQQALSSRLQNAKTLLQQVQTEGKKLTKSQVDELNALQLTGNLDFIEVGRGAEKGLFGVTGKITNFLGTQAALQAEIDSAERGRLETQTKIIQATRAVTEAKKNQVKQETELQNIDLSGGDSDAEAKKAEQERLRIASEEQRRRIEAANHDNALMQINFQKDLQLTDAGFEHKKNMIDALHDYEMSGLNDMEARQKKFEKDLQDVQLQRVNAVRQALQKAVEAQVATQAAANVSRAAGGPAALALPGPTGGGGAFDTGMRTGPSSANGGSAPYHQDIMFGSTVSMKERVQLMDQLARGYEAMGRTIEFSNDAVKNERYRSSMSYEAKSSLISRAQAAHAGRAGGSGRPAMDYYAPLSSGNRFGASVEGQAMLAPSVEGASYSYGGGGAGGRTMTASRNGKMVFEQLHGSMAVPLQGAAPSKNATVNTMARRETTEARDVETAQARQSAALSIAELDIQNQIALAYQQTATIIKQNIDSIYPIEKIKLENKLSQIRHDLQMQNMPEEMIAYEERRAAAVEEGARAEEVLKKNVIDTEAQIKKTTATTAKNEEQVLAKASALTILNKNLELYKQGLEDIPAKQKEMEIRLLEGTLAALKNADALKAQQEAMSLIKGSVESASNSYKGFMKEVAMGGDPSEALKKFQEAITDQVLTVFFDFAMKPVEDFFKNQLSAIFGIETEESARKKAIAIAESQLSELTRAKELQNSIDQNVATFTNLTPAPAPAPATSTTSATPSFSPSAGSSVATNGFPIAAPGGIVASMTEAAMNGAALPFETGAPDATGAVGAWGDSLNTQLSESLTKATKTAETEGNKLGESLGKVTQGIGIAAGAIMGIAAGIGQIKEGGTSNVLGGIGSILMSLGGAVGGFASFFKGANGGVAGGGWKPFPVTAFANGGMVNGPTLGLVGEGKYNEAIVPLPDGKSIPVQMRGGGGNSGLREAMSGSNGRAGGSPILNMSFQSTNINGVEYVSRDQLEQAMAATRRQAAKEGANRGMSMTLDKLQQSPSTRSRLGIGGR